LDEKISNTELFTLLYQLTGFPIFVLNSDFNNIIKRIPTNAPKPSSDYLNMIFKANQTNFKYQLFLIQRSDLIGLIKFNEYYLMVWSRPLPTYIIQRANLPLNESNKFIPKMLAAIEQLEFNMTNSLIKDSDIKISSLTLNHKSLFNTEETHYFHNSNNYEMEMLNAISVGNQHSFEKNYDIYINSGEPGLLDKDNSLRNQKNLVIVATTVFTRAALKSHLQPEIAYRMSDQYIQAVERLKKIDDLREYILNIGLDYIKKIQSLNQIDTLPIITKAQDYILKNLHQSISIEEVASAVSISGSYLMKLFKKYKKVTVETYITNQRIKEAQELLVYSTDSISEISDHLGYKNHAYFSRYFKKSTGIAPSQYRLKYQNSFI